MAPDVHRYGPRIARRPPRLAAFIAFLFLACSPAAAAEPAPWDPLLPKLPSAGAPGDPVAMANASLQATAAATQTALSLGRSFLGSLGIGGSSANPGTGIRGNRVYGAQAVEYVMRRAGT